MPDLNHDSNPIEALTLDYGWKWGKTEIVFDWAHIAPTGSGFESGTFEDVSLDDGTNAERYAAIRQSIREALDLVEDYTGLIFTHTSEIPGGATPDITFGINNYVDPIDGSRPLGTHSFQHQDLRPHSRRRYGLHKHLLAKRRIGILGKYSR